MEHPPIPPIKVKYNGNPDKDIVELKLSRYPTSSTSELYKFKTSLFYNGNREELLLFVRNFNMTLAESGTLETVSKVQYLCRLLHGEELHQFDLLFADVESTGPVTV